MIRTYFLLRYMIVAWFAIPGNETKCFSRLWYSILMEKMVMYGLPVWGFFILFFWYGDAALTPQAMVKLFGLLSLFLLCVTFAIGPLSFFVSSVFSHFKVYRRYLGIAGFLAGVVHAALVFIYYYHLNFSVFVDIQNPRYLGMFMGLLGLTILFLLAVTSIDRIKGWMGYTRWKILQTTGYLALLAVMEHFILVETKNGVFMIQKPFGQGIFILGFVVILIRFIVFLLVEFRQRGKNP